MAQQSADSAQQIRVLLEPAVHWYLEIESKVDFGEAYDSSWDEQVQKALQSLRACSVLSPRQRALVDSAITSFRSYLKQDYDYNFLYEAKTPLRDLASAVHFDFNLAAKPYVAALSEQVSHERNLAE